MAKKPKRTGANANRKAAEKRAKQAKFFGKFLLVAAIVAGGYFAYTSIFPKICTNVSQAVKPKIAINGFEVRGSEGLDSARIARYLTLDTNANVFNVSSREIERKIAKIPGVERVSVKKKPFSQVLDVRITKRAAKYKVNVNNQLHWADKNGWLWQGEKNSDANTFLAFGLKVIDDDAGKRIEEGDFERLEKTFAKIRGTGRNSDNIKTIHFFENDVIEFTARNISVPVRLNGTLRYGSDDFERFESVLRSKNRTPLRYLDAYENCIYSM